MTATDTLRTVETLREAGVPERQAAAQARVIDQAVGHAMDNLVTRDCLRATLYRALLLQAAAIVGAVVALLRLIP